MARTLKLSQVKKQVESLYHRLSTQRLQIDAVGSGKDLDTYGAAQDQVKEIESLMSKLKTEFSSAAEKPLSELSNEAMTNAMINMTPEQLLQFQQEYKARNHK